MEDQVISNVDLFFSKLGEKLGYRLQVSPISFPVKRGEEEFESHLALFGRGAIRVDELDDDIIRINIWTHPGDLTKPEYAIDASAKSPIDQVFLTSEIIFGRGSQFTNPIRPMPPEGLNEHQERLIESTQDDIFSFLDSIGSAAKEMKVGKLHQQYQTWASMNQAKPISEIYFRTLSKRWLYQQGSPTVALNPTERESVVTTAVEENEFVKEIVENEVMYKTALLDSIVRRMAQNDPGIAALFLCGGAGLGKTFQVKEILKEEGVLDRTIWRTGTIAGFTGLLQLLWDYRMGKILVLDDNDKILSNDAAVNILKGALNTNPRDRVVSYTRLRKG